MAGRPLRRARMNSFNFRINPSHRGGEEGLWSVSQGGKKWREKMMETINSSLYNSLVQADHDDHYVRFTKALSLLDDDQLLNFSLSLDSYRD